jgi:hypothetical protein
MISVRRMDRGVDVIVDTGLATSGGVRVLVSTVVGVGGLVGKLVGDWLAAGGVGKVPQAAKKRPPTTAPSPTAARRRNSLRVSEAIHTLPLSWIMPFPFIIAHLGQSSPLYQALTLGREPWSPACGYLLRSANRETCLCIDLLALTRRLASASSHVPIGAYLLKTMPLQQLFRFPIHCWDSHRSRFFIG